MERGGVPSVVSQSITHTRSLALPLTHPPTCSPSRSPTHPPTELLSQSLTHTPTHRKIETAREVTRFTLPL